MLTRDLFAVANLLLETYFTEYKHYLTVRFSDRRLSLHAYTCHAYYCFYILVKSQQQLVSKPVYS